METDRWDQLAVLFEQALSRPPGERAAFLDQACGADADLRAQLDALLHTDDEAKAYFESMADDVFASPQTEATRAEVRPPRRIGHYEVLEKLGGGGMGVVYKARDTGLDRIVALKFLPPHLSTNDQAKQRFIAEAKAASALDHTNICTIHEIGETDDGHLFIAMACYQGQTLKHKIKQGLLPLDEALDIAGQMAKGLEKAHARGIVHRDIKPANIMVTDDGVVKILDFGLAKMADVQLTKTGTTLGTAAYMSPEQARGERVDQRTDIWSLGVVLYEMLTGQRPALGEVEQAVIYAILHEEPASITALNPDLPPDLEHVVALCLEKDRDLRYPTITDVLTDVQVFVQDSGSDLSATFYAARRRAMARRRRVWMGAAAVLLLVMLAFSIPASRRVLLGKQVASPAPTYVAVLPFTSINPADQALADGLVQAVTGMVARLETAKDSLWVIPASEIIDREIKSAREARSMLGVNTVIQIGVQRIGRETQVTLNLVDPNAEVARVLDSATLLGPLDPAFQEEALTALAGLLSTNVDPQVRQAAILDRPTTPGAYAFYLQGSGYLQRYDQAGNIENAIALFNRALGEDSLYALAHAGLCAATWEKYEKTNDTALANEAIASCDYAARLAENQAAVLVPLGSVYLRTGQASKKAETTLLRARELEPGNAEVHRWLGRVYEDQGQIALAEDAYRQAIALKPSIWVYYNELGAMFYYRGRFEEARPLFEQVSRLTPDNHLAYNALAWVELNLNQVEQAKRLFQHAIDLEPNKALASRNLGRLYFREQHYQEAIGWLEKARDLDANDLMIWSSLGHAYYWAGDNPEALASWQRLIEMALPRLEVNPRDDLILRLLADAYVALGDPEQGEAYLHRLLAVPHNTVRVKYSIGRTYEMLHERDLALDWIKQALENRFDPVVPDRDPWLEDLRTDPRYQELREQFLIPSDEPAG